MKKYYFSEELTKLRDQFLDYYVKELHRSQARSMHLRYPIDSLYLFMREKNIEDIPSLTQKDIIQYQYHLYKTKQVSGRTVLHHMHALNSFCRYLFNNDLIWKNPFTDIRYISPPEPEEAKITRRYNFQELLTGWINWMKKEKYHIETVNIRCKSLELFLSFLKERNIKSIYKVTPDTIDEYKKYLTTYQYEPGLYYSPFMQVNHLRYVCSFLLHLDRRKLIKTDPSKHIVFRQYYRELYHKYIAVAGVKPRRKNPLIPNPEVQELVNKFIQYARSRGDSEGNMYNYTRAVEKFYEYISGIGITDLRKVTKREIIDYQSWISNQTCRKGTKYAPNTVQCIMICLRSFFKYLVKYDYLQCDPTSSVDLPKGEDGIPHTCMDEREIKILLNQPNTLDLVGLRDRAVLEVLYSTGIRAGELIKLKIIDIDFPQGLLRIDYPKGGKSYQRIIPIGSVACDYVKQYLSKVRPLIDKTSKGYLFLTSSGKPLRNNNLNTIVRKYVFLCGLRKRISTHSFRVTCATHMLIHGADIRYVQQQLGHRSIRTTQGYTRLVPKDLKAVHSKCHPRERQSLTCII